MRNSSALLLVVTLALVVSCGKTGSKDSDNSAPNKTNETQPKEKSTDQSPTSQNQNKDTGDAKSNSNTNNPSLGEKKSSTKSARQQSIVRRSTINGRTTALGLYFLHVHGKKLDFISADILGSGSSACSISSQHWNADIKNRLERNSLVSEDIKLMSDSKSVVDGDLLIMVEGSDCPVFDFDLRDEVELDIVVYVDGVREQYKF